MSTIAELLAGKGCAVHTIHPVTLRIDTVRMSPRQTRRQTACRDNASPRLVVSHACTSARLTVLTRSFRSSTSLSAQECPVGNRSLMNSAAHR